MNKRAIVHIEIPAASRPAAAKFYGELFGWECQPMDDMHYTTFATDSVGGGFPDVDDHMYKPGDVIIYIDSPHIEVDLKKIESLGGKTVVPKSEIPGIGWFAIFTDPTGNRLALYTDKGMSEK